MWQTYHTPTTLPEAVELLNRYAPDARVVAGGTDLLLELERGVRHTDQLIDITRIPELDVLHLDNDGLVHLGPTLTHNQVVGSALCAQHAFPLVRACWEVGAPQIRNRGTVAGNLITASPANDTITPLWALDARVTVRNSTSERVLAFEDFFKGVRKTCIRDDEIVVDISFPALGANQRGTFLKLGLRRAQAIAVVNVAVVLTFDQAIEDKPGSAVVTGARITLGSVGPTIVRAWQAESSLQGRSLDSDSIARASSLAASETHPISDVRGSAEYRQYMAEVLARRALEQIAHGTEQRGFPARPVMLWGRTNGRYPALKAGTATSSQSADGTVHTRQRGEPIDTLVNGKRYTVEGANHKTLLRMLREDVGLTGTKEGCAEGECGACTVLLDGIAVMACLVPAPRAHGSSIVTVEGLGSPGALHEVQQAFIDQGAAQCGYCTPGFIVSGAALLQEYPTPTREQIKQALTGNLCRCTGYYSIITAIEQAASRTVKNEDKVS